MSEEIKQEVKETKPKKKKGKGCLITVIVVLVLMALAGAMGGGSDDTPTKVETTAAGTEETTAAEETEEAIAEEVKETTAAETTAEETTSDPVFGVGETAELNGVQVSLLSATQSNGSQFAKPDDGNVFMILEFEIANNSDKDISISSIVNFEAYCDDYSVNQDFTATLAPEAEGKNQLDGSVAAGKKMKGIISYQIPADFSKFEITVSPDFWSGKGIDFVVTQ